MNKLTAAEASWLADQVPYTQDIDAILRLLEQTARKGWKHIMIPKITPENFQALKELGYEVKVTSEYQHIKISWDKAGKV